MNSNGRIAIIVSGSLLVISLLAVLFACQPNPQIGIPPREEEIGVVVVEEGSALSISVVGKLEGKSLIIYKAEDGDAICYIVATSSYEYHNSVSCISKKE